MENQVSKPAQSSAFAKTKKINGIFLCVMVVLLIATLLLPNTGATVLLDEFCAVAMLWTAIIWGAVLLVWFKKQATAKTASGKKDILIILIAVVLVLFAAFLISKDLVLDLVHGEQTIVLNRCSVEQASTSKGIISVDYYLIGCDESGETHRFAITSKDYYALLDRYGKYNVGGWSATVHGYPNTGRVVSIG